MNDANVAEIQEQIKAGRVPVIFDQDRSHVLGYVEASELLLQVNRAAAGYAVKADKWERKPLPWRVRFIPSRPLRNWLVNLWRGWKWERTITEAEILEVSLCP